MLGLSRNSTSIGLALIAALLLLPAAGQERKIAPRVPSDMLQGQRLVLRDARFSIEAPANWVWLAVPSEKNGFKNYAASDPDGGLGYAVNVITTDLPWTPQNARDVQVGMAKKLRSLGFEVELLNFTPTDVPVRNSYGFSWRVVVPKGATMYRFGYELKYKDRVISFTCLAPTNSEPTLFTSFARSVRLF
jgi:hypothetical protein